MKTKTDPLANSKLTETILKINPGVDKQAQLQSAKLAKLIKKAGRTSDFHRKSVKNDFESRMEYRKNLYDKMRPKLDDATRARIDKIKEKERKKEAEKMKKEEAERLLRRRSSVRKGEDHSKWETEPQAPGHGGNGPGPPTLDWSSDTGPDFSRRSSLKSSIFDLGLNRSESPGPLFTENPLGSASVIVRRDSSDTKFPEVYLTKAGKDPTPSPRDAQEKLMSFMNLLPAPTPTRFVGKMHKKMIEERKKSEINLLSKSKPSSRRSSISPSTETIQELKESQSPAPSLGKDSTRKQSITKAAKAISKVGDLARKIKRENSKSDDSDSKKTTPKSTPGVSPMSSARASPLMKAKRGGKPKPADKEKIEAKEDTELEEEQNKELKHRIFFVEKKELTDEEVLNELGREAWVPQKNRSNLQGLMKATTIAKRLAKEKKELRLERDTSIVYSGSLRNKLSKDSGKDKGKVLAGTAKFLGKMIHRKDRYGLIVEPPVEGETNGKEENPIIVALDKLNIKLNGRDSKSSMSSLSHKNDVIVTEAAPAETSVPAVKGAASGDASGDPDVLTVLKGGLCQVTQETIFNWNTNNNDKIDIELKPIFIPF